MVKCVNVGMMNKTKIITIPSTCEYSNLQAVRYDKDDEDSDEYWIRSICYNKVVGFSVGIVNPSVEFSTDKADTKITIRYVCKDCALEYSNDWVPTISIETGEFLFSGVFGTSMPADQIRELYQGV